MFCASCVTEKLHFWSNRTCYLNMYLFLSTFSSPSYWKEPQNTNPWKEWSLAVILGKALLPSHIQSVCMELHCGWHCFPVTCVVMSPLTACSWVSRLWNTADATTKDSGKPYIQRKQKHLSISTLHYKPNIVPKQNLSCLIRPKGKQNILFIWWWS